jgi:hypothetical protein
MNRIRRPWAVSRRDTDGVQLNTLDQSGKQQDADEHGQAEKTRAEASTQIVDLRHGSLQELEVDIQNVLQDGEIKDLDEDTSPYPEVRAVVPEVDDPNMPVNTLRMWILGIIWVFVGAGVNQFFSLRYPAVHIVSIVAELLAYPMGVALAYTLPIMTLQLPFGMGVWRANPDRHFNIKEHVVIVIMSNVTIGFAGGADATGIIQAAIKFYGFKLSPGFSVMVTLCCQILGFGVAGLCHPWLVEPAAIIWPGVLGNCALLNSLHSRANAVANGWQISRLKFFMIVMACAFTWYWLPGGLFVALSYFTWICWVGMPLLYLWPVLMAVCCRLRPTTSWSIKYSECKPVWVGLEVLSHSLATLTLHSGLFPVTFDWSQIAYNTNPLLSPSWAAINVFAGFAFFFWSMQIGLAYLKLESDTLQLSFPVYIIPILVKSSPYLPLRQEILLTCYLGYTAFLPMMTADVYDNTGKSDTQPASSLGGYVRLIDQVLRIMSRRS